MPLSFAPVSITKSHTIVFIPVDVVGVRIEMPSNQPIVLLRESNGSRYLPIWIGGVEATAIAMAQQGIVSARPQSHDLMRDLLEASGSVLTSVHITGGGEGLYFAELSLRNDQEALAAVSARPSDAIALALRTKSNILVDSDLFDSSGIEIPEGKSEESEVEAFREFLDQIDPEDFSE